MNFRVVNKHNNKEKWALQMKLCLFVVFWHSFPYLALINLEFTMYTRLDKLVVIHLCMTPKNWHYRYVPPHPTEAVLFVVRFN